MNGSDPCPFCNPASRVVDSNARAFAIRDAFPVTPGHTLIISKRHCPDFFQLTPAETADCFELVKSQRRHLIQTLKPDGFNIGVNVGEAAGQSVFQVHIHVIPQFKGDHPRPRGGIRNVLLWTGHGARRTGDPPQG